MLDISGRCENINCQYPHCNTQVGEIDKCPGCDQITMSNNIWINTNRQSCCLGLHPGEMLEQRGARLGAWLDERREETFDEETGDEEDEEEDEEEKEEEKKQEY